MNVLSEMAAALERESDLLLNRYGSTKVSPLTLGLTAAMTVLAQREEALRAEFNARLDQLEVKNDRRD